MEVVRTRPAPNFTLSLKIFRNLCDLGDLCVSATVTLGLFLDGDKDTATVRGDEKTL